MKDIPVRKLDSEFSSAHFPPKVRSEYHQILDKKLKKDGIVILEAFGKNHLKSRNQNPSVGGPCDLDYLFSTKELQSDFEHYKILQLEEREIELREGLYHNGMSSVTRSMGQKK